MAQNTARQVQSVWKFLTVGEPAVLNATAHATQQRQLTALLKGSSSFTETHADDHDTILVMPCTDLRDKYHG